MLCVDVFSCVFALVDFIDSTAFFFIIFSVFVFPGFCFVCSFFCLCQCRSDGERAGPGAGEGGSVEVVAVVASSGKLEPEHDGGWREQRHSQGTEGTYMVYVGGLLRLSYAASGRRSPTGSTSDRA